MKARPDGPNRDAERGRDFLRRQAFNLGHQQDDAFRLTQIIHGPFELIEISSCGELSLRIHMKGPARGQLAHRSTPPSEGSPSTCKEPGRDAKEPRSAAGPSIERCSSPCSGEKGHVDDVLDIVRVMRRSGDETVDGRLMSVVQDSERAGLSPGKSAQCFRITDQALIDQPGAGLADRGHRDPHMMPM
jgi:hypothetical protein